MANIKITKKMLDETPNLFQSEKDFSRHILPELRKLANVHPDIDAMIKIAEEKAK